MATSFPLLVQDSSPLVFVCDSDLPLLKKIEDLLRPVYAVQTFDRGSLLLEALDGPRQPELVVLSCPSLSHSLSMVKQIAAACPSTRVLLMSTEEEAEEIAQAMQFGASGFLRKPFRERELRDAVKFQIDPEPVESTSARLQLVTPREVPGTAGRAAVETQVEEEDELKLDHGSSFVRSSKVMCELEARAALVARSDIPVLILGESGTGKEVLAKYVHFMSERKDKIFLKVNCAAMPVGLLESELFGYEKGAFTGAMNSNPGKFEICDGGTIFLDEIGEMPGVLQAKLLHVLQDGLYSRLGSRTIMKADVRVIAATNIDIKAAIAEKRFREDLYYRINGFSFTLPPLRERREEITTFARHFMQKAARRFGRKPLTFSKGLLKALNRYSWPGNLRELESVINRYLILGDEELIIEALAVDESQMTEVSRPVEVTRGVGLQQQMRSLKGSAESAAIASALDETKWNRRAAARKMQISYTALRYKIKQYDLERPASFTSPE